MDKAAEKEQGRPGMFFKLVTDMGISQKRYFEIRSLFALKEFLSEEITMYKKSRREKK